MNPLGTIAVCLAQCLCSSRILITIDIAVDINCDI